MLLVLSRHTVAMMRHRRYLRMMVLRMVRQSISRRPALSMSETAGDRDERDKKRCDESKHVIKIDVPARGRSRYEFAEAPFAEGAESILQLVELQPR